MFKCNIVLEFAAVCALCVGYGTAQPPKAVLLDTEFVELGPYGFVPRQIVRQKPGKHFVFVRTVVPIRPLVLRLLRETGSEKLKDVPIQAGKGYWNEVLDLTPGNYILTEANHPSWICKITIGNSK